MINEGKSLFMSRSLSAMLPCKKIYVLMYDWNFIICSAIQKDKKKQDKKKKWWITKYGWQKRHVAWFKKRKTCSRKYQCCEKWYALIGRTGYRQLINRYAGNNSEFNGWLYVCNNILIYTYMLLILYWKLLKNIYQDYDKLAP